MYATQKHALTEARQYEHAPASVGSAASIFQQMAGQAGNQAMLAHLGQRSEPASTGESLPNAIMQRFERKSGVPLDDVRVHYNSDKPDKFDAEAYARGNEIFIGPGNERDLEHEVGHVVQQKMGQVRPTGIEHGFAVNRSPALEHGADVGAIPQAVGAAAEPVVQCCGNKTGEEKKSSTEASASHGKFSDEELEKAKHKLDKAGLFDEKKGIFLAEKFKGASISSHKVEGKTEKEKRVGSLYFGGTSLDEYPKDEQKEIVKIVREYIRARKNPEGSEEAVHNCEEKLRPFLRKADSGGRIRATHGHGPKISRHGGILRINTQEEGEERLFEILYDEKEDNSFKIKTHLSRGALVTKDTEEGEDGTVSKISNFSTGQFQDLAKTAKAAQNYYKNNKKEKGKTTAADEANTRFYNYLTPEDKDKLHINSPQDIINQRAEKRKNRSSPLPLSPGSSSPTENT